MRSIKMNAIKIARFGIFALCFIMAFAIIFAGPASDLVNEVAVAAEDEGTMTWATGDHGELTADYFNFPGTDGSVRSWVKEETFINTTFSLDNVNTYTSRDDNSVAFTNGNGGFTFGLASRAKGSYQAFVVFNYNMSTFLLDLARFHSNVELSVTLSADFTKERGDKTGISAMARSKMMKAEEMSSLTGGDGLDSVPGISASGSDSGHLDNTVTLTKDNPYLSLAFAFGGAYQAVGREAPIRTFSNIKLTFTITMTDHADSSATYIKDGEAPVIAGVDVKNIEPLRVDNLNGETVFDNGDGTFTSTTPWNYYPSHTPNNITQNIEDQILALYQSNVDYVDNRNNAYHNSYVNSETDKKYVDGNVYYKKVASIYTDAYSYGRTLTNGQKNVTTATSGTQWFASGIKSVQIGENVVNVYEINSGVSALTPIEITEDDKPVTYGWYRVTKNHRAEVYVETFFCKNGNFNVTVTDYGDKQITRAINISGIDLDDPTAMEKFADDAKEYLLESSEFASSGGWNSIKWHNASTLAFDFNEDESDTMPGHTPYVWFYSVVKASTPEQLTSANWQREELLGKIPFAVNGLSFVYDFETGYANATYSNGAVQYGVGNQNGGANATGVGYYLFTFYKMDLSGRFNTATNTRSYYVKVDYEKAVHTLEKQSNGNVLANTDWAAGAPLDVILTQDKPNISGNTLTFNYLDEDGTEAIANIFVKDGQIVSVDANGNVESVIGNSFTYNEGTGRETIVSYSINGEGKAVWSIRFASRHADTIQGKLVYDIYNYTTNFDVVTGTYLEAKDLLSYTDLGTDNVYRNGVHIRADRNAPVAPNLMNRDELEGEYIVEAESFDIPDVADRSWFTDSWTFPGQFDFSDELHAEFGAEIKVYYAMKNVVNTADLATGSCVANFIKDFETGYGDLDTYGFDFYTSIASDGLGDLNPLDIGLDANLGSGMRVFFFWTVDQAGNRSALNKYYILSDANTYYVTGHIDNGIFTTQTDVTLVSGGSKTAYKRGQSAVVDYAIDDASPYVPYKLMVDSGSEELYPLWITEDPTSKDISYDKAPITVDGTTFTLFMDSVDGTLDKMDTQPGNAMDIYFFFREYIDLSVINTSVYYEGAPTTVPYTISNENAIPFIEYNFKGTDGEGNPVEFATNDRPVDVGTYTFTMHIKTDHYITDDPYEMDYFINKKPVEIKINSTTGVYGDEQKFGYTVYGLVGKDLAAWNASNYTFTPESGLYLPTPDKWILLGGSNLTQDKFNTQKVGAYKLVFDTALSNGEISSNYELPTLVEAKHVISQREIVVTVVEGTKVYGDSDSTINFVVSKSSLPAGITASNITTVIKNATSVPSDDSSVIKLTGDGLITREAGEDVGTYAYRASTSAFDVDSNYKVVINVEGKLFTITKRTVNVTIKEHQEFVWTESGAYDVVYSLDDYRYADALSAVWSFAQTGDANTDGGFEIYTMIVGAELSSSNSNVAFAFTEGHTVTVKKALPEAKTIVITRVGQALSKVYDGTPDIAGVVITDLDKAGFDVVFSGGELSEGYSIEFTPTISGKNVGNYLVEVSPFSIKVYGADDQEIKDYTVLIESYNFSITPATVTVAPTFATTEKVYGEMDSVYGIGFEASSALAGVDFSTIINGSFVRTIYDGEEAKALGERYDAVSDADGKFTVGGVTYRYGVSVGTAFTSSDPNFVVEVADLSSYSLVIKQREIKFADIDLTGAYANSKSFNNSNNVVFGEGEKAMMFGLTNLLVRVEDDVHLDFTALFSDATGIEAGDNKEVEFTEFALTGEDSTNYVLVGADGYVHKVTTTKTGGTIKITEEPLVIEKRFFSIEKVYDGTSTITEADIKIDSQCMLAGVKFSIVKSVAFNNANVTTNFATDLVLMFEGIDENTFDYSDEAFAMFSFELGGAKLTLKSVPGTITPKEITLEDITSMTATDRTFNGKTAVDVEYTIDSDVFGEDDGYGDLGLTITANSVDANAGVHKVEIDAPVVSAGSNYSINITSEAITSYFGLDVEIKKAQVELNVNYDPKKEYEGVDKTTLVKGSDVTKGEGTAFRLVSDIDMDATVWAEQIGVITWNFDTTNFTYTKDGKPNAGVAYSSGRIVDHNVLVDNLVLATSNASALSNYEIVAVEWNEGIKDYVFVSVDLQADTPMEFECLSVAPMAPMVVTANNNITVNDKIYDGTRNATAQANDLTDFGVLLEDAKYIELKFDATFETKNVGEQNVSLRIIGFGDKADDNRGLAANYAISSSSTWTTRQTIHPAPMVVQANVGEKVYDGTTSIDLGRIRYTLEGKYATETDSYSVNVRAGHYLDANVYDELGEIPEYKSAKLYGIELKNLSTSKVNYYPVISSSEPIEGKVALTEEQLGALPATDSQGNPIYYYEIQQEDFYIISEKDYNKLAVKPADTHLIGVYVRAGVDYYIFDDGAGLEDQYRTALAVDTSAKGKITPKSVSIAVDVINADVFNKEYDGTNKFFGTLGKDYKVSTAGGFVGTDNEKVTLDTSRFTVAYTSSKAGATDIKFVFGERALVALGDDKTYLNYSATGATFVVKGVIAQVEMEVALGDITATYGDDPSTYAFKLTYNVNGTNVVVKDGRGYVAYDGTNHPLGYNDFWASLSDDDKNARRYDLVDGKFVQANDGKYIVLEDTFTTPSIETNANKQSVVSEYYATLKGGSATNYFFTPVYSTAKGSKVTIGKKDLTVTAFNGSDYTADYLGALPAIQLSYTGFVNGDGANKITVKPGAVKYMFFDGTKLVEMPENAKPNDKLEEGQYYAVVVDTALLEANNYNITLGAEEAKLVISIPELTGITMKDSTATYDGTPLNDKVLVSGSLSGVTPDYKFYKGSVVAEENRVTDVKNVGVYTVVATFTKGIGDYTQSTTITRTLTVNKASIKVDPSIGGYDYHKHNFADEIKNAILASLTGTVGADHNLVKDAIVISFYQDGSKVSKIEDAGAYVVEVTFTAPTTLDSDSKVILGNYNDYTFTYNFKVNPAPITITINLDATKLVAEFDEEGKFVLADTIPVVFTYDFGEAYKAKYGAKASDIDPSKFQVQFTLSGSAVKASKAVNGSGVFEFVIEYLTSGKSTVTDSDIEGYKVISVGKDDTPAKNVNKNYRLTGNHGALSVSLVTIGSEEFSIEFLDGIGVVAPGLALNTNEFYADDALEEGDDGYEYWSAINSYTPYISTESHTATLETVVQLSMVSNGALVQPDGAVQVTLQLYLNNDVSEYVFYTVGPDSALHQLTDYEIDEDGIITYQATTIDSLIAFHLTKNAPKMVEQEGLPEWIWYVVGGVGGALVIAATVTGIVVGKKKKAKKEEGDDTPDDDKPEDKKEEKPDKPEDKKDDKPEVKEEPKKEEPKPEPKAEEPKAEEPKPEVKEEPKAEPAPVKPRPSKPSVVGKKKPPVIGQKVMADGAPAAANATSANLVAQASAPAPNATPAKPAEAPKAEPKKPAEAPKANAPKAEPAKPADAPKAEPKKPAEAPKAEPAKPAEAPKAEPKKPANVGEKKPPVVGDKKPSVVGDKPAPEAPKADAPEAPKADAPKAPPVV